MDNEKASNCITVAEAATFLEIGQQELRLGLITGALPFGAAIPNQKKYGTTYRYIIPRARFNKWVNGGDLENRVPLTDNIIKFRDGRIFIRSAYLGNDNPYWQQLRKESESENQANK